MSARDDRRAMEVAWFGSPLSRETELTVHRREGFEHGWRAAKALQAELEAALDQAVRMANDHASEVVASRAYEARARDIVEAMAEAPMAKWSVYWITKARELLGWRPRAISVGADGENALAEAKGLPVGRCGAMHPFMGRCRKQAGHDDGHYSSTETGACTWLSGKPA